MANDSHDAFVRCEFRTHRTGVFGLAKIVTPDKLYFLAVDAPGIIDLFKFKINAGLDIITWTLERSGLLKSGGGDQAVVREREQTVALGAVQRLEGGK